MALRDIAVLELLFATGVRVSELCSLQYGDVRLDEGEIKIYGKGAKERFVQIANHDVLGALSRYQEVYKDAMALSGTFFVNRLCRPLSDQSVRGIINKYTKLAGVENHITPHMFRHPNVKPKTKSFSTFLKFFKAALYAPTWGVFLLFKYLTEHSGYAQIHFAAVGRMDANIEITEQIPVLQVSIQIPAKPGEITEQQNVNVSIYRLRMKLQQTGAVFKGQAACYIAGNANDFKIMFLCIALQSVPLCRQRLRTVRPVVSHTAVNPSLFLFHHAASIQKSFIFQTIST